MAFQFDLDTDLEEPVSDSSGSYTIDITLGFDVDAGLAVLMSVMLVNGDSYLHGEVEGVFDLQFGIRIQDLNTNNVSAPDFTIPTGRRYVPKSAASAVLTTIHDAIEDLVESVLPAYITMETYYPNLPEKALVKYHEITSIITDCGYNVTEAFRNGTNGINYWFFSRG